MKEFSYGVCPYRIRNYTTEILLCRPTGRDDWSFVKGKIEPGETEEECAARECFEETGIIVYPKWFESNYVSKNKRKDIKVFLIDEIYCDFSNIVLSLGEISELMWVVIDDYFVEIQPNQLDIYLAIVSKFIKRRYSFKEFDELCGTVGYYD